MGTFMGKLDVERRLKGWQESLALALIAIIPVALVPLLGADTDQLATATKAARLIAGLTLLLASLLFYLDWRARPAPRPAWVVAATIVVSAQVLTNAGLALADRPGLDEHSGWPLLACTVTMVLAACLTAPALSSSTTSSPNPLVAGGTIASVDVALRLLLGLVGVPMAEPWIFTLTFFLLVGYVGLGIALYRHPVLPRWASRRLAVMFILVGVGQIAVFGPEAGPGATLVGTAAKLAAGLVWAAAAYVMLSEDVESQRLRSSALEGTLLELEESSHGARERLHEVQSTLAGLASASELLADDSLPGPTRHRLEDAIRSELARLERLVRRTRSEFELVDLDHTLGVLTQLHRVRGREVHWEPSGVVVPGCPDAVAEAVNILLENAATHAGDGPHRLQVTGPREGDGHVEISVADDGPGIPEELRPRVFDWGVGRPDSPGQGIGLHLAHRLVAEQGGTLTLSTEVERGSTFVIRLPGMRARTEWLDERTDA